MQPNYAIHSLPNDGSPTLNRKLAALCNEGVRSIFPGENMILQAPKLLDSPDAVERALRKMHCWICVAPNASSGAMTLSEGQWVGMYAVQGPLQPGDSQYFDEGTPLAPTNSLWVSRRMFLHEQHRNQEAVMGLHQAMEAHVRRHHQAACRGFGIAQVRFNAREGSAAFAMHSANAGHVHLVRPLAYRDVLEEDGTLALLPSVVLEETPARVWETAWTLFEMRIECS